MVIVNGNAEISDTELDGLTTDERAALQRRADVTRVTIAEYFQGVVTDVILAAVAENSVRKSEIVSDAFVRADAATQDAVKALLGVVIAPSPIAEEVEGK